MKANWQNLYILWSALFLGLSCAADPDAPPSTGRRTGFELSGQESRRTKQSAASSQSLPARSVRPGRPGSQLQSDFAPLPDVSVTCSVSDLVVRVKPSFYGLGADAEELKLGSSCKSNGVLRPSGDLLFTYPLTACDAVRELPHGYLVYKFVLHYESSRGRFPGRPQRVHVDIECRYQRDHHVFQLAVKPTWQTAVLRKRLRGRPSDFQINLMDESWSEPVKSQEYLLGQTVHFQVSASHLPKRRKLYISSCYAAPSSGAQSSLKYTIIDNMGCLLDSKKDPDASQFISRTNSTLRFSLKSFQFTADPDTEINIHCKLSVTSGDPGPAHKSCTYRRNRWTALAGDDSICDCCDSQCVPSKRRRAVFEGSASIGLLVSDQSYTAEDVNSSTDEPRRSPDAEMHGWENVWETTDLENDGKEERVENALGGTPDLDELDLKHRVEDTGVGSHGFDKNVRGGERGGFIETKGHETGSEEGETEPDLNPNGDEAQHWAQPQPGARGELELTGSEGEENTEYRVEREEDEGRRLSEGEKTWYFTWR